MFMNEKNSESTRKKHTNSLPKKGGGKLGRSEIVQVRLDPKLRYKMEIAGKIKNRTVSSVFEELADSLELTVQYKKMSGEDADKSSLKDLVDKVWNRDGVTRFVQLAQRAPHLLSEHESFIWEFISSQSYFWIDSPKSGGRRLLTLLVREIWDELASCTEEDDFDYQVLKDSIFKLASEKKMNERIKNREKKLEELQELLNDIWG